jgi:integrase
MLGKIRLAKLQPDDIMRLLANLQRPAQTARTKDGLSPRTRQYVLSILRTALRSAHSSELIARNVAELVKAPRVTQHEVQPLNLESVAVLLEATKGHRLEHLIAFLLGSGLRLGEALALRWADVDLEHASIRVSHTLERLPGKPWRIAEPESASGGRVVPLIGPAADSLRAQRKRVAELRLAAASGPITTRCSPTQA